MSLRNTRVVIVAAEFNAELVDAMVETAQTELKAAGADLVRVVRVSGSYEVPLLAELHLVQEDVDALVVLGYIERGETLHGEVMGHVVHGALVQLQLKYHKPIGMGIIGPGATAEQAQQRKTGSARAAVRAALRSCQLLAEYRGTPAP
jgi:6,7-dimethyl-8-ribityllumazine synthase